MGPTIELIKFADHILPFIGNYMTWNIRVIDGIGHNLSNWTIFCIDAGSLVLPY